MAINKNTTNREAIEELIQIRDKRSKLRKFRFNAAQEFYWKHKTRRNIIIKARQKGLSKVIDADQLIDCIRKEGTNAVVISHERDATTRLFKAVRDYIEHLGRKPHVSIDSKSEIRFPKRSSSYFIGTAGQKAFGRGDTLHRVHMSEAAFYVDFDTIFTGVSEAAEYGQIDIETTPNGREAVYEMYQKAKRGESSFTAIFIPWFIDQEYSVENMTEKEKQGLSVAMQELFAMPDDEFMLTLNEEETRLMERVKIEYPDLPGLTPGMMKWRRMKIQDRGIKFYQEYPEDDVSCFLQTERSVFSHIRVDLSQKIPLDNFTPWAERKGWTKKQIELFYGETFYGAVDGAEGIQGGDAHCFAVIRVDPETGKGAVIYELHSNEPIDSFDGKVHKICKEFKIHLGVEKNGVGVAHCNRFRQLGTPFMEYETTGTSRPVLITDLEEAYRKEELIESYTEAENEARDMQYSEKGRAEHPTDKHDDRVFARGIALQMIKRPKPGVSFI